MNWMTDQELVKHGFVDAYVLFLMQRTGLLLEEALEVERELCTRLPSGDELIGRKRFLRLIQEHVSVAYSWMSRSWHPF